MPTCISYVVAVNKQIHMLSHNIQAPASMSITSSLKSPHSVSPNMGPYHSFSQKQSPHSVLPNMVPNHYL